MSEQLKRELKSRIRFEVKDAEKGMVKAVFATIGVKDYDDDLTMPGAFEDGAEVLISSYGHKTWWGEMPVGKGTISVVNDQAILDGQFFLDTVGGKETFNVVKNTGSLQEWSYGFDVLETGEVTEDLRQKGIRRVLKKLKVYEVSPVMLGAGIETQTIDMKSAPTKPEQPAPAAVTAPDVALNAAARKEFARFSTNRADAAAK